MKRIWSLLKSDISLVLREPYFLFFDLLFAPAAFFFFVTVMGAPTSSFVFHMYVAAPTGQTIIEQNAEQMGNFRVHFVPQDVSDPVRWTLDTAIKAKHDPVLLIFPSHWEDNVQIGKEIPVELYASADNPNAYLVTVFLESLAESMGLVTDRPTPFAVQGTSFEAVERPTVDRVTIQTLLIMWLIVGGMHAVSQYSFLVESGMNKRLLVTPLRKVELIVALVLEAMIVLLGVSIGVLLLAKVMYHATIMNTPANILYIIMGEIVMVTFSATMGLFIAVLLKEPARMAWGPLGIYILLMFISGLTLPVAFFPETLRHIAELLPTRRLIMALEAALLYNRPGWSLMVYPALVSLAFFAGTVLLMPWRETRRT